MVRGLILARVIPKTQNMVVDAALINTKYYKVRIKGEVENPGNIVVASFMPRCSSYWKGSLRATINIGQQLYSYLVTS